MSRNVDLPGVQIGDARIIERHDMDGPSPALTIEGTIGGVHGNRITVSAEWWRENTPDPTPGLDS